MASSQPAVYSGLLPLGVATAEMREAGDPSQLLPEEAAQVGRAVDKRIREFAAGRTCARRALATFGIANRVLGVAADRRPEWPNTMVGSITHTDGFCAAAVAQRSEFLNVGIDTEVVKPVDESLRARICVAAEIEWVRSLPSRDQAAAALLIFSAKEAVYKCQYGIVGEWLDFADIIVEVDAWPHLDATASFTATPTRSIALARRVPMPLRGLYRFHEGFVSAGMALRVPGSQ